jgi:hypothetical protein
MNDAGVEIRNARLSMLSPVLGLAVAVHRTALFNPETYTVRRSVPTNDSLPLKKSLETQRSCTMQPGVTTGLESVMLHSQAEMVGSTPNLDIDAELQSQIYLANWLTLHSVSEEIGKSSRLSDLLQVHGFPQQQHAKMIRTVIASLMARVMTQIAV